MGYCIVPDYRNEAVVCQHPCHHTGCAAYRRDWLSGDGICRVCGQQLEPGQSYYYETGRSQYAKVHSGCSLAGSQPARS